MSFLDLRFPTAISYGAVGGPGYSTDVVTLYSGHESRNQNWSQSRCAYDVARGITDQATLTAFITFFRIAKGRANCFRFQDFSDYQVSSSEGITPLISGSTYQLKKRYTNAGGTEDRTITLPVSAVVKSGVTTMVLGVDYTLNLTTGVLTKIGALTPDSWSGQFDVRCRFDIDQVKLTAENYNYFKTQSIPLVEVRP